MNPAKTIIQIFGGEADVARITERSVSRVYCWTYPKEKGGTGGLIPAECQQQLMAYARLNDLPLKPEDFFPEDAT
ncbi:hypothetical protein Q8W25_17765 [Shimia thalassica]|uniref:hypothetical protein n=1 Tax=Shimia thalassica TaxID=1715693 RepID=UPI002734EE8B|nr:hypothetical protein [Shimia thalassica]MDP2495880.1 hypothetical protein [Shimia thalassica]